MRTEFTMTLFYNLERELTAIHDIQIFREKTLLLLQLNQGSTVFSVTQKKTLASLSINKTLFY